MFTFLLIMILVIVGLVLGVLSLVGVTALLAPLVDVLLGVALIWIIVRLFRKK